MQPSGAMGGFSVLLKDTTACYQEERGIKPATCRLLDDLLYLLSYCPPKYKLIKYSWLPCLDIRQTRAGLKTELVPLKIHSTWNPNPHHQPVTVTVCSPKTTTRRRNVK